MAFLFFLLALPLIAQEKKKNRFFYFGSSAVSYKGSLNASYAKWTGALNAGLYFNPEKFLSGSAHVSIGSITGSNPDFTIDSKTYPSVKPIQTFSTSYFSLHYGLVARLLNRKKWCISITQGLGFFRFEPRDTEGRKLSDNALTRAPGEQFNKVSAVLPSNLNIHYKFSDHVRFGFEAGWLNPTTNYLDNTDKLGPTTSDNIANYKFLVLIK